MLTTIDRYILRAISVPFLTSLGLFFIVVTFAQLLRVSDSVTGLGISGHEVLRALMYSLPPLLGLLIPVSCLFASLLGIGQLSVQREILGLSAAGMRPYVLLRMPALLGMCMSLFSAVAMGYGEPWGIRGLRQVMSRSAQRAMAQGVQAGTFYEWIPGVTFWVEKRHADHLEHILFSDQRNRDRPLTIVAHAGRITTGQNSADLVFQMQNGAIWAEDTQTHVHHVVHFEESFYKLNVGDLVGQKARTLAATQEMTIAQLWHESHNPLQPFERRAWFTITLQRKFAVPLGTLIFALLAVPLGCRSRNGAAARGLLISCAIVAVYYYLGRSVELAARAGHFPPLLAAWVPDLLGLALLLFLLWRLPKSCQ